MRANLRFEIERPGDVVQRELRHAILQRCDIVGSKKILACEFVVSARERDRPSSRSRRRPAGMRTA